MIPFEQLIHGSIVKLLKDFDGHNKGEFYKLPMVGFRPLVINPLYDDMDTTEELEIEEIEGIELNTQILEKMGFKSYGEGYSLEEKEDKVLIVEFTELGLSWSYFDGFSNIQIRRSISTVHEFQLFYIGFFGIDFCLNVESIKI